MSVSSILRGTASKGKIEFVPGDGQKWLSALCRLEGKEIEVSLPRARRRKRTLNQNSYYWGVVVALLAESAGYDADEMHDALRFRFLRTHDGPLPTVRSTTDLSTAEFEEYMTQCRRLGAEMYGMYVPEPNECEFS